VYATINLFQKLLDSFSILDEDKKNQLHYIFSLSEDKNINYLEFLLY
jgi:hypothetical protein